jgi:PAS domain S-box-containing protein
MTLLSHPLSIRTQLLALVLAVVLPTIGIGAYYVFNVSQEVREAAYAQVKILADNTAGNLDQILQDNQTVLSRLAARPLAKLNERIFTHSPGNAIQVVLDGEDKFLLHSADPQAIGKPLPIAQADAIRGKTTGLLSMPDTDGRQRLYAIAPVRDTPWRVLASMPEDEVFAAYRGRLIQTAAIRIFIWILVLALAWRIASGIATPIRELASTAAKVAGGDRAARARVSGPTEIETVASEFNRMLDALALQREERATMAAHIDQLFRRARDVIVLFDLSGNVVDANDAAVATYGYSLDELRRLNIRDLRAKEVHATIDRDWQDSTLPSGVLYETVNRRKDGSTFPAEISAQTLEIEGKTYRQAFIRDISTRKKVQATLQEKQVKLLETERELLVAQESLAEAARLEAVGRLAAGVAHEVKNPLTVIRLGIDYLSKQPSQQNNQEVLQDVRQAIDRADSVTKDLLDFARQKQFDRRPTDINGVIDNAIHLINHEIKSRNITIVRNRDDRLPQIYADPDRLAQVFINLLSNAAQAIEKDGTIEIVTRLLRLSENDLDHADTSVFNVGEQVISVDVTDDGPGIPVDHTQKIFEPFFTTKPMGEGTGLGLAITRNIVIMHRGSIAIFNRPEGGATVHLMFRISREQVTHE